MVEVELEHDPARSAPRARVATADAARTRLIILSILGGAATISGVGIFCWPTTLGGVKTALVYIHDASGDLLMLAGVAYLIVHLKRTWRMKKRVVSRWTGYVTVASFIAAGATGIYGQVEELPSGSVANTIHLLSSLALIVLACFHGAWGFFGPARRP